MKKKNLLNSPSNTSVLQTHQQIQLSSFEGPIPSPEVLEKYHRIDPSIVIKIVEMAASQATHRQLQETKGLDAEIAELQQKRLQEQTALNAEIIDLQQKRLQEQIALEAGITNLKQVRLQEQSTSEQDSNFKDRGQYFGALVVVIALFLGAYVALHGYQIAGSIVGTGGLAGIITSFIYGRPHGNKKETPPESHS